MTTYVVFECANAGLSNNCGGSTDVVLTTTDFEDVMRRTKQPLQFNTSWYEVWKCNEKGVFIMDLQTMTCSPLTG